MVGISAVHGLQVAELLESAFREVNWEEQVEVDDGAIKVAIVTAQRGEIDTR